MSKIRRGRAQLEELGYATHVTIGDVRNIKLERINLPSVHADITLLVNHYGLVINKIMGHFYPWTCSLTLADRATPFTAMTTDTELNHKYNHVNPFIWHLSHFTKKLFEERPTDSNLQNRIVPSTHMWDDMLQRCMQ